ncbi:MAG: GTP-binding protein [Candidatus Omnitrophota bacterium]
MRDDLMPKIAITGHIDHGKSTLIGALMLGTKAVPADKMQELKRISKELGKDTELAFLVDQLREEREKNITIDTTEIILKTPKGHYGIIDTPGHLEFIKNMLSGSSHADAAIIIIDAGEGLREQTRRHIFLLKILAINDVIVVINKMDLVRFEQARFLELKDETFSLMEKAGLKPIACIPSCAKQSINIIRKSSLMKWYHGPSVLEALNLIKPPVDMLKSPLRLPVQDVYAKGNEKIIVGRIASGEIQKGQEVNVLPSGQVGKVAKILFSFGDEKNNAKRGENIGLVLTPSNSVQRGDVICGASDRIAAVDELRGTLFLLNGTARKGDEFLLRCSTQESICQITRIEQRINSSTLEKLEEDAEQLFTKEIGVLHFALKKSCVIENRTGTKELGRFVIEKNGLPCGAGTVI